MDNNSTDNAAISYLSKPILDDPTAQLFLGDDAQILAKFRFAFLEKNSTFMDEIRSSLQDKNALQIKRLSHKLKSSSKFIGAERMNHLCEALEHLCKEIGEDGFEKIYDLANITINEFDVLRIVILKRH